ncbi:MAG TPA: class I SAM-dependent methyltransferase [Burkholderiaceae bacterium]|jgi:SAM-dependent methyltransferase
MQSIDFGRTAADYRRHRAGFPADFFARVAPYGVGFKTQEVLDIGTGTGTLARGFAHRGCSVTGVDSAAALLQQAREMDSEAGVAIRYVEARAEHTGLPDASFDVVTAGQCWHWFDRAVAAQEAMRLLRPGGVLAIAHFDWLPLPGNLVSLSESLITQCNPQWNMGGGKGIYPQWFSDLAQGGFVAIESFSFDVDVPYTHEGWRGRLRASAGIAASLAPDAIAQFDRALADLLAAKFPAPVLAVPHRVFCVLGRKPN